AIWNELEAHDWQMLAYYHSHPATPAYPSSRDVLWSRNWPGTLYIIFSLADPTAPVVRAFHVADEKIAEHCIAIEPGPRLAFPQALRVARHDRVLVESGLSPTLNCSLPLRRRLERMAPYVARPSRRWQSR